MFEGDGKGSRKCGWFSHHKFCMGALPARRRNNCQVIAVNLLLYFEISSLLLFLITPSKVSPCSFSLLKTIAKSFSLLLERGRAITIWGAIEKSLICHRNVWKKNISHFGCTNNIFAYCSSIVARDIFMFDIICVARGTLKIIRLDLFCLGWARKLIIG